MYDYFFKSFAFICKMSSGLEEKSICMCTILVLKSAQTKISSHAKMEPFNISNIESINLYSRTISGKSWKKEKIDVIFIDEITEMRDCHLLTSVTGRQIVLEPGPCDPSPPGSLPMLPREDMG